MTDVHTQFGGSIPENYDRYLAPLLFHHYGEDIARRIDAFTGGRVLETACGTGISTQYLRAALPDDVEIVATDLNAPMLDYARKHRGGLVNVSFEEADAQNLPYADQSFDAVVCQFGFMFFPDKLQGFREARRMLKPGSQLAFNVWDSLDHNTFAAVAQDTIASFFAEDPPTFYYTPFSYSEVEPIMSALADAGFRDAEVSHVETTGEVPSAADLATGIVKGNPSITEIEERGSADPQAVVDAVADRIRESFGDDPVRVPLRALVFTARAA